MDFYEQVLAAPCHLCSQRSYLHGDEQRIELPLKYRLHSAAELLANLVYSNIPGVFLLDPGKRNCIASTEVRESLNEMVCYHSGLRQNSFTIFCDPISVCVVLQLYKPAI